MRFVALIAAILAACNSCNFDLPPPHTGPDSPVPPPASCETACARRAFLKCAGADKCVDACNRGEDAGGALVWPVACMTDAASCDAQDICRQGNQ